jgi:hypothetical protein
VEGLNGSGRSPSALTLQKALDDIVALAKPGDAARKVKSLPNYHAHTVTVPGTTHLYCYYSSCTY